MSDFLTQMAAGSRARAYATLARHSIEELTALAQAAPAAPALRLDPSGFDLIAEMKLRSPAAGRLSGPREDPAQRVAGYAAAGAAAVSILTEPTRFDGSLDHLAAAAPVLAARAVPAMRKDFLVDPCQVLEARIAGAGGVLVILRLLPRPEIEALLACAAQQGLFVLLEAFDAADIELLHELLAIPGPRARLLAGVNCRDLSTLAIVPRRLIELAPLLPQGVPRVAESGVLGADDARRVAQAGYQLALVGSALMQGGDPVPLARALLAAGRSAARERC
ncbi:MAG: indole-3-glycerol-phosphate synthase TrpC [Proteobacteria bacterium]|nr:indole-3-glycerol-phosphate synthase TrpC [Pseudomonadota bacterium]